MGEEGLGAYARICAYPEAMWYLPGTMTPEQTEEQMARFGRHREERGFGLWAIEDKASGTFLTS